MDGAKYSLVGAMNPRERGRKVFDTELGGEASFAKALDSLGVWSTHVENSMQSGFPDRYLGQGRWIEFKALVFKYKNSRGGYRQSTAKGRPRRSILMHNLFRPSQRIMIPKLMEAGDKVWTVIFLHAPDRHTHFIMGHYQDIAYMSEVQVDSASVPFYYSRPETLTYIGDQLAKEPSANVRVPLRLGGGSSSENKQAPA